MLRHSSLAVTILPQVIGALQAPDAQERAEALSSLAQVRAERLQHSC